METAMDSALADLLITVSWEKQGISHTDRFFVHGFNAWRDMVPGSLTHKVLSAPGPARFTPGGLIPDHAPKNVYDLPWSRLRPELAALSPKPGRFYPQGLIMGVPGVFKGNVTPFRVIGADGSGIRADLNHALAGIPLDISVEITAKPGKAKERGGACTDWVEQALSGPGMQARHGSEAPDFFSGRAFDRKDPSPDNRFYSTDRFVHHIDHRARQNLARLYAPLIRRGDIILDLMAGWESHLPDTVRPGRVHGIGMNAAELARNPVLTSHEVRDLNQAPVMDFNDHHFDLITCSLSVEYLVRPFEVFTEAARVLKPGGTFAVAFSNRWFPEKTIRVWEELHEFERMGLVLEYFRASGRFEDLATLSLRGYPRPVDDPYFPQQRWSDPLFVVTGKAKG